MLHTQSLNEGGIIDFDPLFLSLPESDQLFSLLKNNIKWEQKYYTDRKTKQQYPQPRLTAWFADDSNMALLFLLL